MKIGMVWRVLLRWHLLALLASVLAAPVAAREVAIQAGEHDDFTRLAFHLDGADWRFGRVADGYGLRVAGEQVFLDGRVHDVTTRERLAALHRVEGGIDIAPGCECHARLFPYGDGWLVIDIIEGPPDPDSPNEVPLDPVAAPPAPVIDRGPLPLLPVRAPPRLLPGLSVPSPAPLAAPDPPAPAPTRTAALGEAMAAGMLRAADLGLLDLAAPRSALDEPPPPPQSEQITLAVTVPATPGVVVQNSMDDVLGPAGQLRAAGCLEDDLFDAGVWAGSGDFFTELARRRADLTDFGGTVLSDAAENLARLYLAYGFGREAIETLALAPRDDRAREVMRLIALVVDSRPVDPAMLADQAPCAGPVVLWRALALETLTDLDELARIEAVTTLRRLPEPLRRQLGPRLALLFAEAGDALAADELLHRDNSQSEPPDSGAAAIEVARAAEDPEATAARLEAAAHGDARAEPQALIEMVDSIIARSTEPDPGDITLLAAAAFEHRGQPEEAALLAARVRLLSYTGAHREALDLAHRLPPATRDEALLTALNSFTEDSDDGIFLELAFDDLARPPDAATANALADRLISLGFPDHALALMRGTDPGPNLTERRYLRAAAAAALGRADLVEAELLGLTDARAERIRADIAPLPPASEPVTEAPPLRPDDLAGPLAHGRALIEEAEATRDRAQALLELIAAGAPP